MFRLIQRLSAIALCFLLFCSCSQSTLPAPDLDDAAEQFVRIALEFDEYDPLYVDAYSGPADWAENAKESLRSREELSRETSELLTDLESMSPTAPDEKGRHKSLLAKVRALDTRMRMLNGEVFTFAEEARLLYGIEVPKFDFAEFDELLVEMDAVVPGPGPLRERIDRVYETAYIPEDKVRVVFERAVEECRRRTLEYIDLPDTEQINVEFVDGAHWAGNLEYQGANVSRMQIGAAATLTTGGAVNLACHEGYPGHHVQLILLEQRYLQDKVWKEHYIHPLHSPAALIIEGAGTYAPRLAFPGDELFEFQRDVLVPLAGLGTVDLRTLDKLDEIRTRLFSAHVAIAQLYLDGDISSEQAAERLGKYGMMSPESAERQLSFFDEYRSYIVNYNIGAAAVATYLDDSGDTEAERWAAYERLIEEQVFPEDRRLAH